MICEGYGGYKLDTYNMVEKLKLSLAPYKLMSQLSRGFFDNNTVSSCYPPGRVISAYNYLFERITGDYPATCFNISETTVDNKSVEIKEVTVLEKSFCDILNFKKESFNKEQKKILIFTPMSGHNPTLLRGTAEALLPHFDVYITSWKNAREVPLSQGNFNFDDYVNYSIDFIRFFGRDLNILSVCQPSLSLLVALSLMSEDKEESIPRTLTFIGGPVDTRENATIINEYMIEQDLDLIKRNIICKVPDSYPGRGRLVYPGFMQLINFISMNMNNHISSHHDLFNNLISGDRESVDLHNKFYDEYFSVSDISADFYLETVKHAFKDYTFPKGEMICNNRLVKPYLIKDTALFCVEGEHDDISSVGQAKAALSICKGVAQDKKEYYLEEKTGHLGCFLGEKFCNNILPRIISFTDKHSK